MSMLNIFNVAGSAVSAQAQRLNVVASNLANADTVAGPDGQAYKARQVVFQTVLLGSQGGDAAAAGVTVSTVTEDNTPGRRVHETGISWNDPSGDTLRAWLGIEREAFYDSSRIAIVATGLCYPGTGASGDLPPQPQCAPTWQPRFRAALPALRLTLLVGSHAQAYYLRKRRKRTLAATVHAWREYLPAYFPLPHPSPRNRLWLRSSCWRPSSVDFLV